MSQEARFFIGDRHLQAEPFHYKMCGLDDVYLLNGFTLEETDYGRGVSIHGARELHKAIGEHLIFRKKSLSPREIRFLRKEMDITQEQLANGLRVTGQTVARYEKGETEMPGAAERLLRILYAFHLLPEQERRDVIERLLLDAQDENVDEIAGPVYFGANARGEWDQARESKGG